MTYRLLTRVSGRTLHSRQHPHKNSIWGQKNDAELMCLSQSCRCSLLVLRRVAVFTTCVPNLNILHSEIVGLVLLGKRSIHHRKEQTALLLHLCVYPMLQDHP